MVSPRKRRVSGAGVTGTAGEGLASGVELSPPGEPGAEEPPPQAAIAAVQSRTAAARIDHLAIRIVLCWALYIVRRVQASMADLRVRARGRRSGRPALRGRA